MGIRWHQEYLGAPVWAFYVCAAFLAVALGNWSWIPLAASVGSLAVLIASYALLKQTERPSTQRYWYLTAAAGVVACPLYVLVAYILGHTLSL
jgi:hypothetical protein